MRVYKVLWAIGFGLLGNFALLFLLLGVTQGSETDSDNIVTSVSWQVETVDTSGRGNSSLAINSNGYPLISYEKDGGSFQNLAYVQWDGSQWVSEIVATMDLGTADTSLALDVNGNPHISYAACNPWSCPARFAERSGNSWSITQDMDGSGSLVIDSGGNPHISYKYGNIVGHTSLRYATMAAGVWITATIEGDPISNPNTSLKLDGSEHPHISYYRGDTLKYAYWNGSTWISQTVGTAAAVSHNLGRHVSLVLDAEDYPHIVYYDGAAQDLMYAKWVGSGWIKQTVDSSGDVGRYASLVLDSHGFPHISYHDSTNHSVKHAHWTGEKWQINIVEEDVGNGNATSLAIDDDDRLHLSYYFYGGTSNYALKHAWGDVITTPRYAIYLPFVTINSD